MTDLDGLRTQWSEMFSKSLPTKACAHDPAQPKWPVHVDHCFGRIILDNVIGQAKQPWMKAIKAPAIKNMDESQLQACIDLGQKILEGKVDLVELDRISLSVRGKADKKYSATSTEQREKNSTSRISAATPIAKQKRLAEQSETEPDSKRAKSGKKQTALSFATKHEDVQSPSNDGNHENVEIILHKISSNDKLTPYRKRLYSTLLSVPRGRYTTYVAMSDYLHSSARAVGSGMRNNPYAPEVPCHRVLAADGSIGGFGGSWGKDGQHANKKVDLLKKEGVKFDSRGKVIGPPYRAMHDLTINQ